LLLRVEAGESAVAAAVEKKGAAVLERSDRGGGGRGAALRLQPLPWRRVRVLRDYEFG